MAERDLKAIGGSPPMLGSCMLTSNTPNQHLIRHRLGEAQSSRDVTVTSMCTQCFAVMHKPVCFPSTSVGHLEVTLMKRRPLWPFCTHLLTVQTWSFSMQWVKSPFLCPHTAHIEHCITCARLSTTSLSQTSPCFSDSSLTNLRCKI